MDTRRAGRRAGRRADDTGYFIHYHSKLPMVCILCILASTHTLEYSNCSTRSSMDTTTRVLLEYAYVLSSSSTTS